MKKAIVVTSLSLLLAKSNGKGRHKRQNGIGKINSKLVSRASPDRSVFLRQQLEESKKSAQTCQNASSILELAESKVCIEIAL